MNIPFGKERPDGEHWEEDPGIRPDMQDTGETKCLCRTIA